MILLVPLDINHSKGSVIQKLYFVNVFTCMYVHDQTLYTV